MAYEVRWGKVFKKGVKIHVHKPFSMSPQAEEVIGKPDPFLKGKLGGNCNVTACQKPGARWWNTGTRAYYCSACAREINKYCGLEPKLCFPSTLRGNPGPELQDFPTGE